MQDQVKKYLACRAFEKSKQNKTGQQKKRACGAVFEIQKDLEVETILPEWWELLCRRG